MKMRPGILLGVIVFMTASALAQELIPADRSNGSAAAYGIITETEPNDNADQADQVAIGDTIDAAITSGSDVDYFTFDCLEGDTIQITGEYRGEKLVALNMQLYNEARSQRLGLCEFLGTSLKTIACVMPYTGKYYLKCLSNNFDGYIPGPNGRLARRAQRAGLTLTEAEAAAALEGEYRLRIERFVKRAPELEYLGVHEEGSSTYATLGFFPNASPTTATIEYGPTALYGSSIIAATNINGIALSSPFKISVPGLVPGLYYHYRVRLENGLGIFVSDDRVFQKAAASLEWKRLESPAAISLSAVDFLDERNGIVCGDSMIFKTEDGGKSWRNINPLGHVTRSIQAVDYVTRDKIFVGCSNNAFKSEDGGETWTRIPINAPTMPPPDISKVIFYDANIGVLVDQSYFGGILKTVDGGTTWSRIFAGYHRILTSIAVLDKDTFILPCRESGPGPQYPFSFLYKTTDGGATWTYFSTGMGYSLSYIASFDSHHGLAIGRKYRNVILKTDDAGATWSECFRANDDTWLGNITASGASNATVLAGHSIVLQTADGGETWQPQNTGVDQTINAIASLPNGLTWAVGDGGTVLVHDDRLFSWHATLSVRDNAGTAGTTLSYGTSITATDGIDAPQGEASLPPPPFGFDARFELPTGDASWKDFRREGQDSIEWIATFQPGDAGYPMTFTWDNTALPEGSFHLRDRVGGSIVNVDMKNQNSFTLANHGIMSLSLLYRRQITIPLSYQQGWNMVSVPVAASDMAPASIFSGLAAPVYDYTDRYNIATTLAVGKGYWAKFSRAASATLCGLCVPATTIPLASGWNLIGGYDRSLNISKLTTLPPDLFTSSFYEYTDTYVEPAAIEPGKAYWIRAGAAGAIDIAAAQGDEGGSHKAAVSSIDPKWMRVIVRDNSGREAIVYAAGSGADPDKYALPPPPPSGAFDVRWAADRRLERLDMGPRDLIIRSAEYPVTLTITGGDVRVCDKVGGTIINTVVRDGAGLQIRNEDITRLEIRAAEIPLSYALGQNYPNPFNPVTTIKFALPEKVPVQLAIYNMLGQRVSQPIDREMDAGYYEITWNAQPFASGVYFYELRTPRYRDVRKMILLK